MDDIPNKPSAQEQPSPTVRTPSGSITIQLRKTVIANGDETNELTFREPTGGDIERCGNPVLIDMAADPPRISFDTKSMTQMMAALAIVPPSTIRQLHTRDWETIAWRLCPFFLPELLTM